METSTETTITTAADVPAGVTQEAPAAGAITVGALPVERSADAAAGRNPMRALRLPEETDPVPDTGRMIVMCAWAAAVGLLGLVVAVRTLVAILHAPGPGWLVPTVISIGAAGTVCAGAAFATIHHRWLPWQLLGFSSLLLCANLILVVTQF